MAIGGFFILRREECDMDRNNVKVYKKLCLAGYFKGIKIPNEKFFIGIGKISMDDTLLLEGNAFLKHEYRILVDQHKNNFILVNHKPLM